MAESMVTTTERALAPVRANQGRRSLFSMLTGVGAVALVTPAVAAVPMVEVPLAESPELLALGKRLDDLIARHVTAIAREAQAEEGLARRMPPLPPELIASHTESHRWTQTVRTAGGEVTFEGGCPLRAYTASLMQLWLDEHPEISRHTVVSRRVRKLLRIAKRYEAEVSEAERVTEMSERRDAVWDLRIAMQTLVDEVTAIEPKTTVGVNIYARAVLAASTMLKDRWPRQASYQEELGSGLASALLRLEKEAAHG